jgi:hypothetical protein
MSLENLKTKVAKFLTEHKLTTLHDESPRGVKGGGVNVTVYHKGMFTTKEFKTVVKKQFPNAKFKYGCWEEWSNLTFKM